MLKNSQAKRRQNNRNTKQRTDGTDKKKEMIDLFPTIPMIIVNVNKLSLSTEDRNSQTGDESKI